jgi:hypothetical protein
MVSAIIQIVVGLLIWKIVPDWINVKGRKKKNFIKLCLNILGVVIIIFGIISFIRWIFTLIS